MQRIKWFIASGGLALLMVMGTGCAQKATPETGQPPVETAAVQDLSKKVDDVSKKVDAVASIQPKFAIPMREYGQRFTNMYYAAKGGNWALAAYMLNYARKAMTPASFTKPDEFKTLKGWESSNFPPIVDALEKKDFPALQKAFDNTVTSCNSCHAAMGYPYAIYKLPNQPFDAHLDYTKATEPKDFKDFDNLRK